VPDLWPALGYDQTAAEIAEALRTASETVVVEGPPGAGKSFLARGIGGLWEEAGGSAVVAEGDVFSSDVELFPFGLAMAGLSRGWRSVGRALSGVARAGEAAFGTFGVITSTVEAVGDMRRQLRRGRTIFLGDAEQEILYDFERLADKKPILLVADNLHWWDAKSLALLARLRDPRMWTAFPFLAELRVLAVQTPEPYQRAVSPEAHEALLARGRARGIRLERVPREGFEDVLVALGAPRRPAEDAADVVYALSGGHLALASQCAARMTDGETENLLAAADSAEFVRALLTDRIQALGALGKQAVAVLQIAAVLGLTFRRDELACAAGVDEAATARLLRYCREEALVRVLNGVGSFAHDVYRQHFLDIDAEQRIAIHERLSECLRDLRPDEYDVRCLNALRAERPREAATLAVQAALQAERDGRPWRELPGALVGAIEHERWGPVVDRFVEAQQHLNQYRFAECLNALDRLPLDLPRQLLAEADYLRASCRMSTRSEDDRALGRSILEAWEGYEEKEPEIGARLMRLLLYGFTHLVDKEPGRRLEGRIQQVFSDRFDVASRDARYTLSRIAGSIYEPEVAFVRNREAAEHFGPRPGQTLLRRPVEYYRCLVNRGASEIAIARYRDARTTYQEVEELVAQYAEGVFPRLDYPHTNGLLAEYRLGAVAADEAIRRQRATVERFEVAGDPFYVQNALGVYLALADRLDESIELFDHLHAELMRSRRDPEPSMVYLIRANRCSAWFVAGETEAARAEWTALAEVVGRIPYSIRPYLVKRHERLAGVIGTGQTMSARELDEHLVTHGPVEFGPLWDNFGRGFRMPEVEFWRDN
jgi:energy-coupling factor transporter ATP-binding protein EcfA2